MHTNFTTHHALLSLCTPINYNLLWKYCEHRVPFYIFIKQVTWRLFFTRHKCVWDRYIKILQQRKGKRKKKKLKTTFIRNIESKNKSNPKSPTLDFISVYKRRTKYKKDFSPIYIFVSLSLGFCFSVSNFSLVFHKFGNTWGTDLDKEYQLVP